MKYLFEIQKFTAFLLWIIFHDFPEITTLPAEQTVQFVSDYFHVRSISSVIFCTCSHEESKSFIPLAKKNLIIISKYPDYNNDMKELINHVQSAHHKIGIYVNYSCDVTKQLIKQVSDMKMFERKYKWLVWTKMKQNAVDEFMHYNLDVFCDVTLATDHMAYATLYIIYKIYYEEHKLKEVSIGFWTKENGLKVQVGGTKVERRANLEGLLVRAQTVFTSLKMKTTDENWMQSAMNSSYEKDLDNLSRFTIVLFINLAKLHNFILNISITDEMGILKENGEYSGLIGAIQRNETDIGLAGYTQERTIPFLDYSILLWKNRPVFIFRSHKPFASAYSILTPFSSTAWLCIFIVLFLISLALVMAKRCNGSNTDDMTLSGNLLLTVGMVCQRGFDKCSSRLSERIILLTSLMFGLIIFTFYGSIIVTLALKRKWVTIHNADDLLKSDLEIGVINTSDFREYFEKSNNSLVSKLYKEKIKGHRSFFEVERGIELVQSSKFAFYCKESSLYRKITDKLSMNEICQLSEVELVEPYQVPSPMRKNFFLKKFINCGLVRLKEVGVISREHSIWYPTKPECQGTDEVLSASIACLMVAYIIYSIGVIMSITLLIIEMYIHSKCKQ